jgi:hypothetical protein
MQTAFVSIGLRPVAAAAIDKLQVLACRVPALGRVQIAVAVDARHIGVSGCCVVLFVHEDRYVFARKGSRELFVGVTLEAFFIVLSRCRSSCQAKNRGC